MSTYLKYKPVWYRIFVLISLIFGVVFVLWLLSYTLAAKFSGFSFQQLLAPDMDDPRMLEIQKWLMSFISSVATFLIPSLLYAYFADPRPMRFLRMDVKPAWWYWIIAVALMVVVLPSAFWLGEWNKQLDLSNVLPGFDKWMKESEVTTNAFIEKMIGKQDIADLFTNLLLLALLPAVAEELLFRGLIQKGLIRMTRNVWVSILLSAFIFSAIHFQFLTFLTRFELGIILGALFWYSGSLWVPILAHFFFNGLQVFMSYRNPAMKDAPGELLSAGMVGISFLLVIALIVLMKRTSTSTMAEVYDDEDDDFILTGPDNRE